MLTNWNFKDEGENSTTQQINRQKSARNLEVIRFDPSEPRAVFFDTKRNTKNIATLSECDCKDFNLAGKNPRKSFKPCMHMETKPKLIVPFQIARIILIFKRLE